MRRLAPAYAALLLASPALVFAGSAMAQTSGQTTVGQPSTQTTVTTSTTTDAAGQVVQESATVTTQPAPAAPVAPAYPQPAPVAPATPAPPTYAQPVPAAPVTPPAPPPPPMTSMPAPSSGMPAMAPSDPTQPYNGATVMTAPPAAPTRYAIDAGQFVVGTPVRTKFDRTLGKVESVDPAAGPVMRVTVRTYDNPPQLRVVEAYWVADVSPQVVHLELTSEQFAGIPGTLAPKEKKPRRGR